MNESPSDKMQYSIHGTAHEYASGHISTMPQLPVHESASSVHHCQTSHSHQSDEYNAALALLCLPVSSRGTRRDAIEQQNHSIITPQASFDSSRASTSLIPAQDHPNPPMLPKPAKKESIPSLFYGSCSLALPQDEDNLSPLHCFVRKYGIEAFVVSEQDAQDKEFWSARNFKVKPGIVGMRCMYCGDRPLRERGPKSVHYPSSTKCIYYSMENWQRHHATNCKFIPKSILRDLKNLMNESKTGSGGRRCYWEDSAIMLGMADTEDGIRFSSHPEVNAQTRPTSMDHTDVSDSTVSNVNDEDQFEKAIVEEGDKDVISEYLFVLMSQMESCTFSEEDRSGSRSKVKDIEVGFPGMQCKHCNGKAGVGRYFPFSIQALSLANSDRNIHNHIKKCRRCPDTVKHDLERLRVDAQKPAQKIKRGSRKIFFSTVWARLHESECRIDGSASPISDDAASLSDKVPASERDVSHRTDRHAKGSTIVQEQPHSDPETKLPGPSDEIKETHDRNEHHRFESLHPGRPQDPAYFQGDQSTKRHFAYNQAAQATKFPVQVARNDPSYFGNAEYSHNAIGSFQTESTYRPMPVLTAPEANHYQMPHYPDQSLRASNSNSYQEYCHPHAGQAHFQIEYSDPRRGNAMHRQPHPFPAMNIHEHQAPDARRYQSVQNSNRTSGWRYDRMHSSNPSYRSCSPSGYTEL